MDGAKEIDLNWSAQIANQNNISEYYWLFDRTYNCKPYGCKVSDSSANGYWTGSAGASETHIAFFVDYSGRLAHFYASVSLPIGGVRPVIEVLKTNL